jgi:hypothetical protein
MKICSKCRGENILFDAWARWDSGTQKLELHSVYDEVYCDDCEGQTSYIDVTQQ